MSPENEAPDVDECGEAAFAGSYGLAASAAPANGGRQRRASAAKADALVSSWHDAETASFTTVAGRDLFVTARHRAVGEQRRERERRRDEVAAATATEPGASAAAGPLGPRQRRAAVGHVRVEEAYDYDSPPEVEEEEESEEDAGARDEDSEEESGRRRGRRGGSGRRGSCAAGAAARRRARPSVETVTTGRPKRQRHSRPVDPDMLVTEEAIEAALQGGPSASSGGGGSSGGEARQTMPRTRTRAPPPLSPTALAAAAAAQAAAAAAAMAHAGALVEEEGVPVMQVPAVLPGMGLTAPQPTAPRPMGAGVSAAALRAARTPSPAAAAAAAAAATAAAAAPSLSEVAGAAGGLAQVPAVVQPAPAAVASAAPGAPAAAPGIGVPLAAHAVHPAAAVSLTAALEAVQGGSSGMLPVVLPAALPSMPAAAAFYEAAAAAVVQAAAAAHGAQAATSTVVGQAAAQQVAQQEGSVVLPGAASSLEVAPGLAQAKVAPTSTAAAPAVAQLPFKLAAAAAPEQSTAAGPAPNAQPWEAPAGPAVLPVQPSVAAAAAVLAAAAPPAEAAQPSAVKQEAVVAAAPSLPPVAVPVPAAQAEAAPLPPRRGAANGTGRTPVDVLYGCAKCRYLRGGCNTCRLREPAFSRPRMRWKPAQGHYQRGIEAAPVFRPTAEEFQDPIAYISKIRPQAEKYGLAHIVPPPGWDPPFALEKGTNGLSMESFRFAVRKQYTSHLCCRAAPAPPAPGTPPKEAAPASCAAAAQGGGTADGRYSGRMGNTLRGAAGEPQQEQQQQQEEQAAEQQATEQQAAAQSSAGQPVEGGPCVGQQGQQAQQGLAAMELDGPAGAAPAGSAEAGPEPAAGLAAAPAAGDAASPRADAVAREDGDVGAAPSPPPPPPPDFGFPHIEKKHTLRSFSAYADWVKEIHFSDPLPAQPIGRSGATARNARTSQRRPRALPNYSTLPEPSIEQIEAEFWRIVESPEERLESLYGQDVDSGHHGSGFPLPRWRRRLLEQHLARQAAAAGSVGGAPVELPDYQDEMERHYAEHPWNINNLPRCPDSVLRYLPGTDGELITGVMVPWLYVGSCLSAFCWHVEDHALCSINYHHMGAPKVWYGVPASATGALEEAVKDALPHLFGANPRLMYQLVTALSPMELKKRGLPVYRVVHEPGSFVVTMPDAYHSGFNCGFNVAEAVNFAPSDWIPYGSDITEKYRSSGKPLTLSHDSLLVSLVKAAELRPSPQQVLAAAEAAAAAAAAVEIAAVAGTGSDPQQQQHAAAEGQPPQQQQPELQTRRMAAATGGATAQEPLSPLGPAPLHRAPTSGIALAAGELALRAAEERRRRTVSFVAVGALPERRMAADAPPKSKDAQGVHTNTADCDCAHCSGDLWLSAVVSPSAPGVAVCPEHAEVLVRRHGCPRDSLVLLYRHSPQELDSLVATAVERVPGAAEAVAAARQRRARIEAHRVRAKPVGPMYETVRPGMPVGALPIPADDEDCACDSEDEDSSDEDWEKEEQQRHASGRGASKRRRSAGGGTKRQRAQRTAGAGARMGGAKRARMQGGRMEGGRMGAGAGPQLVAAAAGALLPALADIAAVFSDAPAAVHAAVEQQPVQDAGAAVAVLAASEATAAPAAAAAAAPAAAEPSAAALPVAEHAPATTEAAAAAESAAPLAAEAAAATQPTQDEPAAAGTAAPKAPLDATEAAAAVADAEAAQGLERAPEAATDGNRQQAATAAAAEMAEAFPALTEAAPAAADANSGVGTAVPAALPAGAAIAAAEHAAQPDDTTLAVDGQQQAAPHQQQQQETEQQQQQESDQKQPQQEPDRQQGQAAAPAEQCPQPAIEPTAETEQLGTATTHGTAAAAVAAARFPAGVEPAAAGAPSQDAAPGPAEVATVPQAPAASGAAGAAADADAAGTEAGPEAPGRGPFFDTSDLPS